MAVRHLLFLSPTPGRIQDIDLKKAIESALEDLLITIAATPRETLGILARDPGLHLIVIVDLISAPLPLSDLVKRIIEINPGVEIILLGDAALTWSSLDLPRFHRPIILNAPIRPATLISIVAKLLEIVDLKEDYAALSRGLKGRLSLARKNVEAVLSLLYRQIGVGIISMRRDGFFTFYNHEARRLTGYTQDELPHINQWAEALFDSQIAVEQILASIARYWTEGAGQEDYPLKIRRKDGLTTTLSLTVLTILDERGEPRQMLALLQDPRDKVSLLEYRAILDSGLLSFYVYDWGQGFVRFTKSGLDLLRQAFDFDCSEEDLLGCRIEDLPLPREAITQWQSFITEANSDPANSTNYLPLGLPGRRFLEHAFIRNIVTDQGTGKGVLAILNHREDLRASRHQDATSPELCRLTLLGLPNPFLLLKTIRNQSGVIEDFFCLEANPAALNLLPRLQWRAAGQPLTSLLPPDSCWEDVLKRAIAVTETGRIMEFELQTDVDGPSPQLIHFWLGKSGDGVGLFFRDVTAKRNEERLLKQYRHIFDHMEESIIVTDLDGLVIDWNPASERMFGYPKEDILGQPVFLLTSTKKGEQLEQETRNILREGSVWKGEYEFIRQDGRTGVAFTVFALLENDQGLSYGTVGLSYDITERKRLEERLTLRTQELQEKNLALGTLLRLAEEERVRACEQVAGDLIHKLTDRLDQILRVKDNPALIEKFVQVALKDFGRSVEPMKPVGNDPISSLTEKEMEVARLIRLGKTTEEVAFLLDKSPDTVRLQRMSIRKKLGLDRRDYNLASYLSRLDLG